MKVALERSNVQIYDRIVLELAQGFRELGHLVVLIDPMVVTSQSKLLALYNLCDWAVISNSCGTLSQRDQDLFLFEKIEARLVFLHHDAPFLQTDLGEIREKLAAFVRQKERSIHFSVERNDAEDLASLGIRSYTTSHINTLGRVAPPNRPTIERDLCFLGHVLPPLRHPIGFESSNDAKYFRSYLDRIIDLAHRVKDDFSPLTQPGEHPSPLERVSRKMQYIQYVHRYSTFHRGAVLEAVSDRNLHIYGGDPVWLNGGVQRRFLGESVSYHQPVFDKGAVSAVFAGSKININLTSLQFDTAVINRVLDCAAAGGFLLTDAKDQLGELTSVADDVSFSSMDELAYKVDFYLRQENEGKRRDLARQLREDLGVSCSLLRVIGAMLGRMIAPSCSRLDTEEPEHRYASSWQLS